MSRRPTWPHATDPIIADSHVKDLEQSITIPSACSTGGPSLLAIGVLTMPILVRTPDLRRYHRAVHYSQSAMRAGRICMRYLVSESEMARLKPAASAVVADENATHSDLLVLPDVPRGPLRKHLPNPGGVRGAGCVLKILAWFQHASRALVKAPFVAYADDDTFWSLARVEQTLSLLRSAAGEADLFRVRVYAGAMQYHSWLDLSTMHSKGWHFNLPGAAKEFESGFNETAARIAHVNSSQATVRHASRRFFRPYPMAHGLGVIVSHALAKQLPVSSAVVDFFALYNLWLTTDAAKTDRELNGPTAKCRLGTDSFVGAWISALTDEPSSNTGRVDPLIGVDLLNFNQAWPWPLPLRCHGPNAFNELNDVHAFHLYGGVAADPSMWIHLHNASMHSEAQRLEETVKGPALRLKAGAPGARDAQLYCRHAKDDSIGEGAKALLDDWLTRGVAANGSETPTVRMRRKYIGSEWVRERGKFREWVYCGVRCLGARVAASTKLNCFAPEAWPHVRRR